MEQSSGASFTGSTLDRAFFRNDPMTVFAGALHLRPGQLLPDGIARTLMQHLSRHPQDTPRLFTGPGFALAHLNLGVLDGDSALQAADGRVSVLAGEPLAGGHTAAMSRTDDLARLHADWVQGRTRVLQGARGAFCAAHVDPASRRAWLAADKLALRPLHYAIDGDVLLFATSMRVMLALAPRLAERSDLTAQAQLAALGHRLGPRTAYEAIRSVEAGHAVEIDAHGARSHAYFRWDDVAPVECDADTFSARLYDTFTDAVRLRLGSQRRVTAHISGGLDSRCVVAVLRDHGTEVRSINFAPADSADMVLGRLAAERLGTRHFEYPHGSTDFWERMLVAHAAWLEALPAAERPPLHARVWTGFAGETVLAPTNLTAAMLPAMRQGRIDDAVRAYLQRVGGELSERLFVRRQRRHMAASLRESVRTEIERNRSTDPARRLHVFQLLNEPRGNLARHHEDIDLRRIEFTIPFCDAELVSLSLSWQIEPLLQHRFYYSWLERFPAGVREVAWQAYPWSLPCPVPPPPQRLRYQWAEDWVSKKARKAELKQLLDQFEACIENPGFPDKLLDRRNLRFAYLLARLGVTRYVYLLRHAHVFAQLASGRGGR
jgi:asparagine synthase (glutamine-hydrolysing)